MSILLLRSLLKRWQGVRGVDAETRLNHGSNGAEVAKYGGVPAEIAGVPHAGITTTMAPFL